MLNILSFAVKQAEMGTILIFKIKVTNSQTAHHIVLCGPPGAPSSVKYY